MELSSMSTLRVNNSIAYPLRIANMFYSSDVYESIIDSLKLCFQHWGQYFGLRSYLRAIIVHPIWICSQLNAIMRDMFLSTLFTVFVTVFTVDIVTFMTPFTCSWYVGGKLSWTPLPKHIRLQK